MPDFVYIVPLQKRFSNLLELFELYLCDAHSKARPIGEGRRGQDIAGEGRALPTVEPACGGYTAGEGHRVLLRIIFCAYIRPHGDAGDSRIDILTVGKKVCAVCPCAGVRAGGIDEFLICLDPSAYLGEVCRIYRRDAAVPARSDIQKKVTAACPAIHKLLYKSCERLIVYIVGGVAPMVVQHLAHLARNGLISVFRRSEWLSALKRDGIYLAVTGDAERMSAGIVYYFLIME